MLVLALVCLVSFVPHGINAQETDVEKKLFKEIVRVADGKMTMTEYGLLSFPMVSDEKTQYKLYSEAPAEGVISRDNFVAMTTGMQAVILFGMAAEANARYAKTFSELLERSEQAFDIEELDEPIGKVDLEINFYLTKGGMQIEYVNTRTGSTNRNTLTWDEIID